MPDPTAPQESLLTSEQLIRVASRLFVAYLLCSAVAELIVIPREIVTVIQYGREGSKGLFSRHLWIMYLNESGLRIILFLTVAKWFYRCGPRIASFFTAAPKPMAWLDTSFREISARRNEPPRIIDRD